MIAVTVDSYCEVHYITFAANLFCPLLLDLWLADNVNHSLAKVGDVTTRANLQAVYGRRDGRPSTFSIIATAGDPRKALYEDCSEALARLMIRYYLLKKQKPNF